MIINIASFTANGKSIADRIASTSGEMNCSFFDREKQSLSDWTRLSFERKEALVFVGASGIAVRAIAPYVRSKLEDSPVLVVDELGQYVIPILSGHVGGANELANMIADNIGAIPIITTATDINHVFAVDVFAVRNGLNILKKEGIQTVSSRLLKGELVTMSIQDLSRVTDMEKLPAGIELVNYPPETGADIIISEEAEILKEAVLPLSPRTLVLGMGCKKGKTMEEIEEQVISSDIDINQVYALASIEIKKDEPGLVEFANKHRLRFQTYTSEDLLAVPGEFESSAFVRATVGVDNVCERAAMLCAGENGQLITKKKAANGITLALSRREWRIEFE